MDKQTLSHYGWLVVITLILAIMLALASPLGTYIGDGVVSIANGYVKTTNEAISEDNIKTEQSNWDDKLNNTLTHTGIIPATGLYIKGTTQTYNTGKKICTNLYLINYETATEYKEGEKFPTPERGDVYIYGQYAYVFQKEFNEGSWLNMDYGWSVLCTNSSIEKPDSVLESINNKPITHLQSTFENNSKLIEMPKIPKTVISLKRAFCSCSKLTTASEIPKNVINMYATFVNCTSLTGKIEINANPTSYDNCFHSVDFNTQNIMLTGNSTKLDALKATGINN